MPDKNCLSRKTKRKAFFPLVDKIFLYSPGSEPLGPLLYFYYLDGSYGRMAAGGLVVSLISIILIALAQKFSRWKIE